MAYASRALTEAETRYAQIEKAIVFACEHFEYYIYGRGAVNVVISANCTQDPSTKHRIGCREENAPELQSEREVQARVNSVLHVKHKPT